MQIAFCFNPESLIMHYENEGGQITNWDNLLPTLILHGVGDNCNSG